MGIPRATGRFLLRIHKKQPFAGSVLQLGRSFVFFTWKELARWADAEGVGLVRPDEIGLSPHPKLAARGCIDDRTLFRALGFSNVHSLDVSAWEGADFLADLNWPVPQELHGRFDLVFDSGTLAHVFDLPTALGSVARMARAGGRVILTEPSNNHVDLGFYMFSPTLFADFFHENRFRIDELWLMELRGAWYRGVYETDRCPAWRYRPGLVDHLRFGSFGIKQLETMVVATRCEDSTSDRPPMQGWYREFLRRWPAELAPGHDDVLGEAVDAKRVEFQEEKEPAAERAWTASDHLLARLKRWRRRVGRHLPPRLPAEDARF